MEERIQGKNREIINYKASSKKCLIAHNEIDVYHLIELDEGRLLSTGQPFLEIFDTIKEANEFLKSEYQKNDIEDGMLFEESVNG